MRGNNKTVAENVIELNGKRYDAVTGAYLGVSHTFVEPAAAPPIAKGRVIDGFIRPTPINAQHAKAAKPHAPTHTASVHHKVAPKPETPAHAAAKQGKPHVPAPAQSNRQHHTPALARPHQPERAKTLMRRAVRKPELSKKPAIRSPGSCRSSSQAAFGNRA